MKPTIIILTLFISLISFSQEKKCSDFKIGKFTYSDPDYADLITERTDSLQTDHYPKMGWKLTSKVKWLTACKYEIEYIEVNIPKMESIIGTKYIIEIIDINKNKILCRTESDGIVIEKEMIKSIE
ncbi:hypothetical protein [uncultured Kordia sp.]|uniref:hypothetical protein n=1 Tax=uncultured Kordia sp. TaxID=507699 RepID=UPI00262F009D|nr:hypothetical protein [uncultured Kordia sp.]